MSRRNFLRMVAAGGAAAAGVAAWRWYPDQGWRNDCRPELTVDSAIADLLEQTLSGLDGKNMVDGHVHMVGNGLDGPGTWLNHTMREWSSPKQKLQMLFYLNAACVQDTPSAGQDYQRGLIRMASELPQGMRLMLLAFDWHHDQVGGIVESRSTFRILDEYAQSAVENGNGHLLWAASIHPYREDAVDALRGAVANGAKAVKWLPPAQGMDPASPKCDAFYAAMAHADIPLIVHAGDEHAVEADEYQALGNPLRLRRALDAGVRVLVAHCATQGQGDDLDQPNGKRRVANFELFERMMGEADYQGRLFGEISAITQINRFDPWLKRILKHDDWGGRLSNGSDYPLPGVMPLFSLRALVREDLLDSKYLPALTSIRNANPILFDLVLKRLLNDQGRVFSTSTFENAAVFGV